MCRRVCVWRRVCLCVTMCGVWYFNTNRFLTIRTTDGTQRSGIVLAWTRRAIPRGRRPRSCVPLLAPDLIQQATLLEDAERRPGLETLPILDGQLSDIDDAEPQQSTGALRHHACAHPRSLRGFRSETNTLNKLLAIYWRSIGDLLAIPIGDLVAILFFAAICAFRV